MTRGQVAAKVRENKAKHPERYCQQPKCLWALSSGPCPKHGTAEEQADHDYEGKYEAADERLTAAYEES